MQIARSLGILFIGLGLVGLCVSGLPFGSGMYGFSSGKTNPYILCGGIGATLLGAALLAYHYLRVAKTAGLSADTRLLYLRLSIYGCGGLIWYFIGYGLIVLVSAYLIDLLILRPVFARIERGAKQTQCTRAEPADSTGGTKV